MDGEWFAREGGVMDVIAFSNLWDIAPDEMISLMNNPRVAAYMPLLADGFTRDTYDAFIIAKRDLWAQHGYGPHAFLINGEFAGWGGLQYESGDADFALVLHPDFWGCGLRIFDAVKDQAFGEMGLNSITALLPPNRANAKSIKRLGFVENGSVGIDGRDFTRFRLFKQ